VVTTTNAEAHIWELASQVHLAELAGHTGEICAVATAECGDVPMVLTGSRDATARLWNARTMELACAPLTGHEGDVNAVTFGKLDGQSIAFTGDDDGIVRGWDPRTGDHLDVQIPEMSDWVTALAFGTVRNKPILAISAANGTILLWNGSTRETLAEIQLHTAPNDLAIHSDGYLCVATAMGVVALRFGDGI
jgi:WD40 repeat protein